MGIQSQRIPFNWITSLLVWISLWTELSMSDYYAKPVTVSRTTDVTYFANIEVPAVNFSTFGVAQITDNVIVLLNNTLNTYGSAWYNKSFDFRKLISPCEALSFEAIFAMEIPEILDSCSGEGLAFNIVSANVTMNELGNGDIMAFGMPSSLSSRTSALSIEFDLKANNYTSDYVIIPHVGLDMQFSNTSTSVFGYYFMKTSYYVWINYRSLTNSLRVYLSDIPIKPQGFSFEYTLDLCSFFSTPVYVGFSAASSNCSSATKISNFSLFTFSETIRSTLPAPVSIRVNSTNNYSQFITSGQSSAGYSLSDYYDEYQVENLNLLSEEMQFTSGSAYYESKIELLRNIDSRCESSSFTAFFNISISSFQPAGDGITFSLIGASAGLDVFKSRTIGGSLGLPTTLINTTGALSVELDLRGNSEFDVFNDPHLAVDINLNLRSIGEPRLLPSLTNQDLNVWVNYIAPARVIQVFLSGYDVQPEIPLLQENVDLCSIMRTDPSNCTTCKSETEAFLGFTASSGAHTCIPELSLFAFDNRWESFRTTVNPSLASNPHEIMLSFDNESLFNLTDGATVRHGSAYLLSNDSVGSVFYHQKFQILNDSSPCKSASFNISFNIAFNLNKTQVNDEGCSNGGITLSVIGATPGDIVTFGGTVSRMGLPSILEAIAGALTIEFDVSFLDTFDGGIGQPHVGIDFGFNFTSRVVQPWPLESLSKVWIEYNATNKIIEVFLSNSSLKPTVCSLILNKLDLCEVFKRSYCGDCGYDSEVFLGFTASKGDCQMSPNLTNVIISSQWDPEPVIPMASSDNDPIISNIVLIASISSSLFITVIVAFILCIFFWRSYLLFLNKLLFIYFFLHLTVFLAYAEKEEKMTIHKYSLQEILAATSKFDDQRAIGKGGFGEVYLGEGPSGVPWAVKRSLTTDETAKKAFQEESYSTAEQIDRMSSMNHKNIVALLGYCNEGNELVLIYEYMALGSLSSVLSNKSSTPLSLLDRVNVAIDITEGLKYLHRLSNHSFIHRDIKSDNILLNEKKQAKLADFGLLKDVQDTELKENSENRTSVVGSVGYVDPSYVKTYKVSTKSDIYSFGVVLLELITGKRAIVKDEGTGEKMIVANWVKANLVQCRFADPCIGDEFDKEAMRKFVKVALLCCQRNDAKRPELDDIFSKLLEIKKMVSGEQADVDNLLEIEIGDTESVNEDLMSSIRSGMTTNEDTFGMPIPTEYMLRK